MATTTEYTAEQLNYFRICYFSTDTLPKGLRSIFKREWDKHYIPTMGEWKDNPRNGMDFYNAESPQNQRRNAHLLATMVNGDRAEWDCTMLFYAILFSDCVGRRLNAIVQTNVDDLRRFRNEEFAHMPRGQLSDRDFQNAMGKVHNAFQALGLSTVQIQEVTNQTTFPTEELRDVLNKVEDLKKELQEKEKQQQDLKDQLQENEEQRQSLADQLQEKEKQRNSLADQLHQKEEHRQGLEDKLQENEEQRQGLEDKLKEREEHRQNLVDQLQQKEEQLHVLEDQLQNDTPSFCILPPKPLHEITARNRQVAEIVQQLRELKQACENNLTYMYISGNPGSGKSQLAGLVAKRFFEDAQVGPRASAFVMTLNAGSLDTLLESYSSFTRQLKCPEFAVTNILNSKDLKTDEKIANLMMLTNTKIDSYTSWLLVADNVKSMSEVYVHLPKLGNEQWARGQLLITTQDTASIPLTSSFIQHVSVKKGMEPNDASSLLANISGIADSEIGKKVAQALDYQPLALASAATYVKQLRQSKLTSHFGWNDYLEKVEKGQRVTTETILAETNPSYPKSMTEATTLAVKEMVSSDKVIAHTFNFLSLCAPQPLSLAILINYILNVDEEIQDKEMINIRIQRCPLILLEDDDSGVYIGVHQVVRDVFQTVMRDHPKSLLHAAINGAVIAFNHFIDDIDNWEDLDSVAQSKGIAPHLKALIISTESLVSKESICQVMKTGMLKLGLTCENHCDFHSALRYYECSLEFFLENFGPEHVLVESTYSRLGSLQEDLGNFEMAKKYQQHVLNFHLKNLGPEHVYVSTAYCNLGSVCEALCEFEQAKGYHRRALNICLKKLGPEDVDVATVYTHLGSVYEALGDFGEAKECHHRALKIRLKKLDPEHVDVATTYSHLGSVHEALGDFEQAKDYHHRDLTISLKKLGPEHVDVASTYSNLGSVYQALGDFEQAKEYHQLAKSIRLKKLEPEHVDVATTYSHLGSLHEAMGDFKKAMEYHDYALEIRLKKLDSEHLDVATTYTFLGSLHEAFGDFQQAKEYHEQALSIRREKHGPEHVHVATTYRHLGSVYQALEDFDQAKVYYRGALTIRLKKLGPEHVHVATTYTLLGSLQEALGAFDQARKYHQQALSILLKKVGPEHVHVATTYSHLGSLHEVSGDFEEAKKYHQQALSIRLKKIGPEHVHVAATYSHLGSVYKALEDFEQAKEYYHLALNIRLRRLGPEHVDVATTYTQLDSLYEALGDLELD